MVWNALNAVTNFALAWLLITVVTARYFGQAWTARRRRSIGTAIYGVVVALGVLAAGVSVTFAVLGAVVGYGVLRAVRYIRG